MPRVSIQWADTETSAAENGGDTVAENTGEIVCDAVTAITRDITADAPEHPVEAGVATTDTVIPQPRRVSFEAHFSAAVFDVDLLGTREAVSTASGDAKVIRDQSGTNRAVDVLELIQQLIDNGTEVDVIGLPNGDCEGFQILSVSISQSSGQYGKLVPVIEIKERITVTSSEVDAPAPQRERARRRSNGGSQTAQEPTEPTRRERNRSSARALIDAVGSLSPN